MKRLTTILSVFIFCVSLFSCEEENMDMMSTETLTLNLSGLEPLGAGYLYEGWVIVDDMPVSTGTFSVAEDGTLSQNQFEVNADELMNASRFVLSIEPSPDNDPAPAATKVLAGSFANQTASLSTDIVGDFSDATGTFFLRTPTDETSGNNGNDQYGVWYGIPGMPPTVSFVLPDLPEGWQYEGWVVGDNGPLTTGTFTSFDMADDAAPFSGTEQAGPPVPGEDFFMNAPEGETFPLDIRGRTVVISVEPEPDDSPAPFVLKPLLGTAGQETAPTTFDFSRNLNSLPGGTVSF